MKLGNRAGDLSKYFVQLNPVIHEARNLPKKAIQSDIKSESSNDLKETILNDEKSVTSNKDSDTDSDAIESEFSLAIQRAVELILKKVKHARHMLISSDQIPQSDHKEPVYQTFIK